jgi:hypothetical protein
MTGIDDQDLVTLESKGRAHKIILFLDLEALKGKK